MSAYKSIGKCFFCHKEYLKAGITKHLNAHLAQIGPATPQGKSYHVKVEEGYADGNGYFLNLWVDGSALMSDIDNFLRAIWLECCGHLSSFTDHRKKRSWSIFDEDEMLNEIEELMAAPAQTVLTKNLKLKYEYDFGSTTQLSITVAEEFPVENPEGIVLLSRNEPLEILCDVCGSEPAASICTVCYDGPGVFCKKCAKKHAKECEDFADYAALPVVNSPRMCVCAYEGGRIDKGRDGIFVKNKADNTGKKK